MTLFENANKLPKQVNQLREGIGAFFSKIDRDPNHWTLLSLVIAVFASLFIYSEQFILGAVLIVLSGFFDWVDGAVARYSRRVTKLGAYIDTVSDRYTEFLYLFPLFFVAIPGVIWPAKVWLSFYLFGAMATTYVKAAAKEKELNIPEIRGGILERAERVGLLTAGIFLAGFDIIFLAYLLPILAILANISAIQRIKKVLDETKPKPVIVEKKI